MPPFLILLVKAAAPDVAGYVVKSIRSALTGQVVLNINPDQEQIALIGLQSLNHAVGVVIPYTLTRSSEGLSLICKEKHADEIKARMTSLSVRFTIGEP